MKFINLYNSIYEKINTSFKKVIVYPGRFHPFHMGHYKTYEYLKENFPDADVYIASSNKVELPDSPFSFDQKKFLAERLGVDYNKMIQTKNPYVAAEITRAYNPDSTALFFAVSKKDMQTNPRFSFKPKKDGSPSYFRPYSEDDQIEPLSKHGYIITTPVFPFKVLGKPALGASQIREAYKKADEPTRLRIIKDLYGTIDKEIVLLWYNVLVNNKEA